VVTPPTCTAAGYTTYTCSRCGDTYTADEVPALGHSFGDPTYVWTADNSSVTATRICSVCSFEETETVAVTSKVDDDGNTILTADFENPAFETQTKVIEADKIDISPADVTADKTPMGLFTAPASPTPKVVLDGVELVLGKDFEIVGYGNNKYPGAATVTVRGIGGYTGEATGAFIVDEPFCDVDESTYHYDDILWMYGMGITKGWGDYPNCEYRPLDPIARADMAAFLYRLAGKPAFVPSGSFSDVPAGLDHYDEIMWLASSGISTGFPDGTFRPYAYIVRCDMAAFLYRLAGKPAFVPGSSPFNDVTPATDHFDEIRWLASTEVSGGFPDGGYHPYGNVTRCDMAAFLHRMDEKGLVAEW
nr:S-layer homology domain-containing protein [Atopobiaceae bacterium]